MLLCPNGPSINSNQFSKAYKRHQELTVLIYTVLLALLFISDDDRKFDFAFAHLSDLVGSRDRDYTNRPFVTSSKSVPVH